MEEKQRKTAAEKFRDSFKTRSFRVGSYSVFSSLIVVAIAVAVVLAVAALPAKYTQFDMTSEGLYSLSGQTVNLCSSLTEDVTIYWMVQAGMEDGQLKALLARYKELSDHVKVREIDPVENPNFASAYTQDLNTNNSVIVVCGDRSKLVDYTEIFVTDYSNYYTTGSLTTSFDGESALTVAIDYVTSMNLPKLYILSGHGEQALPSSVTSAISGQNILTEELSLLTSKTVPDDCACVLVCSPAADISADEKDILQSYLQSGGHMLLVTGYLKDGLPNLTALMADYGTTLNQGIVLDNDSNYNVQGVSYYLLPKLGSHEITTPFIDQYYILMPMAQGLTVSGELREGLSVTQLLTTSDSAFSKANISETGETSTEYEEGDIKGPFALGVAMEENDTRLVWFTANQMLDDNYNTLVAGANQNLFVNALNWMCERENRISIGAKNFDSSASVLVPTADTLKIGLLVVILIPLGILAVGITVVVRRRRR